MNIPESRVLSAVQALGRPTTIEVGERCGYSRSQARKHLRALEAQGQIQALGRRWAVPSRALSPWDEEDQEEVECPSLWWLFGGLVVCVAVLGLLVWVSVRLFSNF